MTAKLMTALRISEQDLAEIDKRAGAYGMTRTAYLIAAATGDLPEQRDARRERLDAVEDRVNRLERAVFEN